MSGASFPSLHNTNRIADFFGLEIEELCLPHGNLRRIFRKPTRSQMPSDASLPSAAKASIHDLVDGLCGMNHDLLKRYEGTYFRYNFAFDCSGRVIRSLFRIVHAGDVFITRHIERIQHRSNGSRRLTTLKYDGVVTAISNCLFVVEYERLMKSCIGHAAFPCIQRPNQRYLTGVQSSLATSTGRPAASRVVLEKVAGLTIAAALRNCGTFEPGQDAIDADVMRLMGNRVEADGDLLAPSIV